MPTVADSLDPDSNFPDWFEQLTADDRDGNPFSPDQLDLIEPEPSTPRPDPSQGFDELFYRLNSHGDLNTVLGEITGDTGR